MLGRHTRLLLRARVEQISELRCRPESGGREGATQRENHVQRAQHQAILFSRTVLTISTMLPFSQASDGMNKVELGREEIKVKRLQFAICVPTVNLMLLQQRLRRDACLVRP